MRDPLCPNIPNGMEERHRHERIHNGFSIVDWWNFDSYIAAIMIDGLKKFKEDGTGVPAEFGTDVTDTGLEEWHAVLDKIIDGFKAYLEINDHLGYDDYLEFYDEAKKKLDNSFELLKTYFQYLWD